MPEPLPLGSIGTRHYGLLLSAVLVTLVCMALPPPFDAATSLGFSLVIMLQIRLLGAVGGPTLMTRLFRQLGWLSLGSLWLWLLTPSQFRNSGLPLLVMLALFELKAYPRLVTRLSQETRVTGDVLKGALSGYLLLGLTGALIMALLESILPGSLSGLAPAASEGNPDALLAWSSIEQVKFINITYFAFVTITTLGYGDVLPVTPLAKLGTIVFSVIGPIYLAVIMGVLIGRYLQEEQSDR